MLDHVNLPVSCLSNSAAFYESVLMSLGMSLLVREEDAIGFGKDTWSFGIVETDESFPSIHLAFEAQSREVVLEFYRAALGAGGIDNGKPGPREQYGPGYYASYVIDPDGHNIEAVCRK